jgi:hypothetical protein
MHLRIFRTFKDDDAPLYHLRRTDLETPDGEFRSLTELETRIEKIVAHEMFQESGTGFTITFALPPETPAITWPPPLSKNEPVRVTVLDGSEQSRIWEFIRVLHTRETNHASHLA